jgi:hypothetical protein
LGLFKGEALDVLRGGLVGSAGLVDVGGEDVEGEAYLDEEVAAARGGGGEDEAGGGHRHYTKRSCGFLRCVQSVLTSVEITGLL